MRIIYILALMLLSTILKAQVGIETNAPQAQLDITATDRGLLVPRVALTSLTVQLPVTNPQGGNIVESTMIYHNGTNSIAPGYYYWSGTAWTRFGVESLNVGLQYYTYDLPNINAPNIDRILLGIPYGSGLHNGDLNNANNLILRGTRTDRYLIHFVGTLVVNTTGNFQLQSRTDDGARIFIDDRMVLNQWVGQAPTTISGATLNLAKGKHKIEFWFFEGDQGESMTFTWLQNANGGPLPRTVSGTDFIIE